MNHQLARILLVEDEEAHAELVCRAFEAHRSRFHLTVAGSLAEARSCISESLPHLIITGLRLPDGLGTGLLPAEGEESTVPLVVMTSQGDQTAAVDAVKAGALDYLVKTQEVLADTPRIAERVLREWKYVIERRTSENGRKLLDEVSQTLSKSGDFESKVTRAMEMLALLTGAEFVTLNLESDYGPALRLVAAAGTAVSTIPPLPGIIGETTLRHSAQNDDRFEELNGSPELLALGVKSTAKIPLKAGHVQIGFLSVLSRKPNYFSSEIVNLLTTVADGLGALLVNAQLNQQLKTSREELSLVDDVAQIITSTLDIDEVYDKFASEARKLVDFDRVALHIIDQDAGTSLLKYTSGIGPPGRNMGQTTPLTNTRSTGLIESTRTIVVDDLAAGPTFPLDRAYLDAGLNSQIIVALVSDGKTVGSLTLRSRRVGAYTARDQAILERLANQIASAVANSELYEESLNSEREQLRLAQRNQVLAEIGQVITASLDIEDIYKRFAGLVRELLPFDWITVNTVDLQNSTLTLEHLTGVDISDRSAGLSVPLAGTFTNLVLQSPGGVIFPPDESNKQASVIAGLAPFIEAGCRSFLGVPLISRGETFAVLNLVSKLPKAYSAEDLDLAITIGQQIAGAIENARQFAERRRLSDENLVMAEIGRVINTSLDINDVYDRLGEEIRTLIPFDRMSLTLVDQGGGVAVPTWVTGTDVPGRRPGDVFAIQGTLADEVIRVKSSMLVEADTEADIKHLPGLLPNFNAGMRSFLASPLYSRDTPIAVIQLRSRHTGVYCQRDLDLLERIGNQIAGAVANSQLYAERKQLSDENLVMAEIGRIISSSSDIDDVYERLGDAIAKLMPFDRMDLCVLDQAREIVFPTWKSGTEISGREVGDEVPLAGSFVGAVSGRRSPIRLEVDSAADLEQQFPGLMPAYNTGMRSFIAAPLMNRDVGIGAIQMHSKNKDVYFDRHLDLLERIGNQITGAVANSQLYAERKQLSDENQVIADIGRIISSSLGITYVFDQVSDEIRKLIPFDASAVSLIDHKRELAMPAWVSGTHVPGRNTGDEIPLAGTLAGEAVQSGLPILLEAGTKADFDSKFPHLIPAYNAGLRSFIAVPLVASGIVTGVFHLRSKERGIYTAAQLDLAERIGNQIAGAITNFQLVQERTRSGNENLVVAEIGRIINSSYDISNVYDLLGDEIRKLIPFDRLDVGLINQEQGTVSPAWISGTQVPGRRVGDVVPLPGSFAGAVADSRAPHLVEAKSAADLKQKLPQLMPAFNVGIRSFMAAPLMDRDVVMGVIQLHSKEQGIYTERHLSLLERIGNQIAGAIATSRLHAERARLASEHLKMAEIRRTISSSLDIFDVYDRLAEAVRELIPLDRMTLSMFEQESETVLQTWQFGTEVPPRPPEIPQAGSFAESVIRSKQPALLCGDYGPDLIERFPELGLNYQAGMRSFMAAPLIYRNTVIGVLQIRSKKLGAYSQWHLDVAARIANEISGAVANAQLYIDRKRLAEENSVMAEIGRIISSTLDIDEVYGRLGEQTRNLIPFDHMSLSLVDQENGVSSVTWTFGENIPDREPGNIVPLDGAFVNKVVLARSPVMLEMDTEADLLSEVPHQLPAFRAGMRSFLGVPLFYREELIGVLQLQSKEQGIYSQRNLDLTERVGNQIAGTVANSQLFAERTRLSEENQVVAEIGRIINSSLDLNDIYDLLSEEIRKLIPFDRFSINLVDFEKGTSSRWVLGLDVPGRRTGDAVPLAGALVGEVVRTRLPILLEPETAAEVDLRFPLLMPAYNSGLRSFMAVPLIDRDAAIGVLQVRSKERGIYTPAHLSSLERIGNQIAGAMSNTQLFVERQLAEAELIKAKENLERTVNERTAELTASNKNLQAEAAERMRAEEVLLQQAAAMNSALDGISIVDEAGEFVYVNEAFVRMYGYNDPDELIGRNFVQTRGEPARFGQEILPALTQNGSWRGETIGQRKDGPEFPQEISMTSLEGAGFVCTDRDITDRRETEQRMQETARLASVGELAAGVAHEINNPLTSVLGFSDLVLKNDLPELVSEDIQTIHNEAQRAAKIVQNLLFFARKGLPQSNIWT